MDTPYRPSLKGEGTTKMAIPSTLPTKERVRINLFCSLMPSEVDRTCYLSGFVLPIFRHNVFSDKEAKNPSEGPMRIGTENERKEHVLSRDSTSIKKRVKKIYILLPLHPWRWSSAFRAGVGRSAS